MSAPHNARKRFGQHFLVRRDLAKRIVGCAALRPGQSVLEVGPGHGALTDILRHQTDQLVLIEIDRDLVRSLRKRYETSPNIRIIEGDVLRIDLAGELREATPITVVANLPYNISTPLLGRFFDTPLIYRRLVLMLQREVAERICASPGGKEYGALSVRAQIIAQANIAFLVPPDAFRPQPKVHSAVIVLEPNPTCALAPQQLDALRSITRTLFSQRRKQLGNSLSTYTPDALPVLRSLNIDPKRRPETLSPDDFVRLILALEKTEQRSGAT